jgi:pimeloyl-ACP methyl ester carboxylesterase
MTIANINNIEIDYKIIGKGHPIVFIAGLGVDKTCWIPQIPEFKKYFKIIVYDNRGIGKSTGNLSPYSIKILADDAAELIEYLNIKKAHIIGTSMGGMIAQELAINYPYLVDKLVLSSTFAKQKYIVEIITKGLKELLGYRTLEIFDIKPHRLLFEKLFSYFLQQIFSEKFIIENKKLIEETLRKNISKITYTETFLKQIGAIYNHNTIERLKMIKSETLILTGTKDKLTIPELSLILEKKFQNSKLIKIKNGNHGMHFENPETFNKIVKDFLL